MKRISSIKGWHAGLITSIRPVPGSPVLWQAGVVTEVSHKACHRIVALPQIKHFPTAIQGPFSSHSRIKTHSIPHCKFLWWLRNTLRTFKRFDVYFEVNQYAIRWNSTFLFLFFLCPVSDSSEVSKVLRIIITVRNIVWLRIWPLCLFRPLGGLSWRDIYCSLISVILLKLGFFLTGSVRCSWKFYFVIIAVPRDGTKYLRNYRFYTGVQGVTIKVL